MAVLRNIARVYTPTVGVGALTLGAAVQGYKTFILAGCANGEVLTYGIHDFNGAGQLIASEVGRGTYNAITNTLTRTTVLASTNADAALNLSGNAQVFITAIAEDFDHTTSILNVGVNTHAQIDLHLASVANPHATTAAQVGAPALVNPSVVGNFVSFSNVTGGQQDSGVSTASFQPVDTTLTTLSALADAVGWLYNNGAGVLSWTTPPLISHNVLDSTYHGDVLTGAITRGDILYGNATPKIARLAKGTSGAILTCDANDTLWSTYFLSGTAAKTYTFPATSQTLAGLAVVGQTFTTDQKITAALACAPSTNAFSTSSIYTAFVIGNLTGANAANGGLYAIARYNKSNEPFTALCGYDDGANRQLYFGGGNWQVPDANEIYFYTAPAYTETNNTGVLRLKITSAGIVTAYASSGFEHTVGTTRLQTYIDASGSWVGNISNHALILYTNNTAYATLSAAGSFGIGNGLYSPSARLHVRNDSATTNAVVEVLRIENTVTGAGVGAVGLGAGISLLAESATNGTSKELAFLSGAFSDATAATWKGYLSLYATDSAVRREGLRIDANGSDVTLLAFGKLAFTQTDLNEYIDSLNDGFMDYGATTAHRFLADLKLPADSRKLLFGAGDDMSIYYDGTNGYVKIDEVAASDLHITTGAAKTLVLDTVAYDDIQFATAVGKIPGANAPTWEAMGTLTYHSEYAFSPGDYIDLQTNEPFHGWKEGENADVHIHFTLKTANSSGGDRYAKFTAYVAAADVNETWTELGPFTAEKTIPNGTAAMTHYLLSLGTATLAGYKIGSQFKARIYRIVATGGTEYADDVYITQLGMHFPKERVGSRNISSA